MNNPQTSEAKVDMINATCPDKPKESLDSQDIESITLTNQMLTKQIIARKDRAIGLTFEGKAGQKLSYTKNNKNICSWVFTPDNKVLLGDTLPTDGKYIMQILALQGFPAIDIAIGLDIISPAVNTTNTCPKKPDNALEKVENISLPTSGSTKASGQLQASKSLGYSFEAQAGQELTYQTKDDICIWILTPDIQILTSKELPKTGKYVVQISSLKGNTEFELEMSLSSSNTSSIPVSPIPSSISRPAPEQAVRDYYAKINRRQYPEAWSQLTPKFQRDKSEDNYAKFIEWWNKVKLVEVQNVKLINKGNDTAAVEANINYRMQDGSGFFDSVRIYFVWNDLNKQWTFNESERL